MKNKKYIIIAVVQETVTQSDGEIRLIVERITEIYGSPFNIPIRTARRSITL